MDWALAETVAAVQIGDDIVVLDLGSDQYTCLRGQSDFTVEGRRVCAPSLNPANPLIEAGYLRPYSPAYDDAVRLPPAPPVQDLQVEPASSIRAAELLDFLSCWVETLLRFPGRPLLALHLQVRDAKPEGPPSDLERLRRRVAVFEALSPWIPFPGACLFRSYLLLRFLQRRGGDARWVIGVRTWPFEAHCWLQLGETVLDDRCERLVRFQPLLAL